VTDVRARNRRTRLIAFLIVAGMVGLAYASVPLYRLFCQVTGFDGTTRRVDATAAAMVAPVAGHSMSIRFDANVSPDLRWQFRPVDTQRTVTIGQRSMAIFTAKNLTDHPITGRAVFNVTPTQAGKYFSKIQCFCFTEQTLQPGQEVQMPVVFYVDPAIVRDPDANDVTEITLSYTFYPVEQPGSGS
jgi:cytochrome c oxidase assembly protein subunit 11